MGVKEKLSKEILASIMRRYDQLGKIMVVEGGIKYDRGKFISNKDAVRILKELTSDT